MIDKALLRPGRFDKILYVGLPDESSRLEILKAHSRVCVRWLFILIPCEDTWFVPIILIYLFVPCEDYIIYFDTMWKYFIRTDHNLYFDTMYHLNFSFTPSLLCVNFTDSLLRFLFIRLPPPLVCFKISPSTFTYLISFTGTDVRDVTQTGQMLDISF